MTCLMMWKFLLKKSKDRHEIVINSFDDQSVVILEKKPNPKNQKYQNKALYLTIKNKTFFC